MLHSADQKKGRVGIVLDNGCLFRAGKESAIRKQLVGEDKIECVILLPEKLFYNTLAPGVILILNHQKSKQRKGRILFIDAREKFGKHPELRKLNILEDKHIEEILETYATFDSRDGSSRSVTTEEIAKNDYVLSVSLYVDDLEQSEQVDIPKSWREVKELDKSMKMLETKIDSFIKEIGYDD
jgi:type I restriction enzyme M protein